MLFRAGRHLIGFYLLRDSLHAGLQQEEPANCFHWALRAQPKRPCYARGSPVQKVPALFIASFSTVPQVLDVVADL